MITVRRYVEAWAWNTKESIFHGKPVGSTPRYTSADEALNDAWRVWPDLPALIYTRRP